MNSAGKSTLTRIAEIAGIVAAIATCLALIPAFGLWRVQDNTNLGPARFVQTTNIFVPTNVIVPVTNAPTNVIVPPTVVATIAPTEAVEPPTSTTQDIATPRAGEERVIGGAPMVFVPAGDFLMGSSDADKDAQSNEKPQHTVYLDAFWMDKFEVTNAQYKKCVDADKCAAPSKSKSFNRDSYYGNPQYDNYPVIYVSWSDAKTFCEWVGKRLPTEAEWEKAARGTDGRIYPWGNAFDQSRVNNNLTANETTEVGNYPSGASPYGALDMAGNIWEWVADWYDANYYSNSPRENPQGPSSGQERVFRGGSWFDAPVFGRAALRFWTYPVVGDDVTGFRCVV